MITSSEFEPRLSKPTGKNPYYRTKSAGGYSPCILGNDAKGRRDLNLNVLPNCVGWAVGRFNEIGGYGQCRWLGSTNAKYFVVLAKNQGLKVSQEPTLGGVMVWGHKSKAGHVAIVEKVLSDNIIVTSESEWNAATFAVYHRARGNGNWREGCYWMGVDYTYLGCVVNPAIIDEEEAELTEEKFKELFLQCMKEYESDKRKQPGDNYALDALKWAKENGIMVGDTTGNQMPQANVKREDLVVILKAMNYDRK